METSRNMRKFFKRIDSIFMFITLKISIAKLRIGPPIARINELV